MPFTGDSSDSSDGEEGHNTASQENTLRGASRTSSGGDTTDQSSGDTGSNPSKSLRASIQGLTLSPAAKVNTGSSPSKIKRGKTLFLLFMLNFRTLAGKNQSISFILYQCNEIIFLELFY